MQDFESKNERYFALALTKALLPHLAFLSSVHTRGEKVTKLVPLYKLCKLVLNLKWQFLLCRNSHHSSHNKEVVIFKPLTMQCGIILKFRSFLYRSILDQDWLWSIQYSFCFIYDSSSFLWLIWTYLAALMH